MIDIIRRMSKLKSRFLRVRGSSWELKINLEKLQEEKKRPEKKIKNHFEAVRG